MYHYHLGAADSDGHISPMQGQSLRGLLVPNKRCPLRFLFVDSAQLHINPNHLISFLLLLHRFHCVARRWVRYWSRQATVALKDARYVGGHLLLVSAVLSSAEDSSLAKKNVYTTKLLIASVTAKITLRLAVSTWCARLI